jgi:hypothetical protein
VYLGGRSVSSCDSARVSILSSTQVQEARGVGRLENLVMDLSDLSSVKGAAEAFLAREERLDVLVHNAGVMTPAKGSTDAHVSRIQYFSAENKEYYFGYVLFFLDGGGFPMEIEKCWVSSKILMQLTRAMILK